MNTSVKTVNHLEITVEELILQIHTTATRKAIETHLAAYLESVEDKFRPVQFREYLRKKKINITYIYTRRQ